MTVSYKIRLSYWSEFLGDDVHTFGLCEVVTHNDKGFKSSDRNLMHQVSLCVAKVFGLDKENVSSIGTNQCSRFFNNDGFCTFLAEIPSEEKALDMNLPMQKKVFIDAEISGFFVPSQRICS